MQVDLRQKNGHAEPFYRPGLDILRFVAFLLVFVAHSLVRNINDATRLGALARAGEFGVCVFFFLSAYLITELLVREKASTGTIEIRSFYIRRVLRIWPLYFAFIAMGWLRGVFSPTHVLSVKWLGAMLLLYTNIYGTHHGYPPGFLLPLWSIAIEEQFYLFWPWLVRRLTPFLIALIAVALLLLSYGRIISLVSLHVPIDTMLWEDSFVQFQFFALGALLALVLRGRIPPVPRPLGVILFIGSLLTFLVAQTGLEDFNPGGRSTAHHVALYFALACVGCLGLFFSFINRTSRKMTPVIYLGRISYGLYMFHFAILSITRSLVERLQGHALTTVLQEIEVMLLALMATIACASFSYRLFETPFLRLKKRYAVIPSRPL